MRDAVFASSSAFVNFFLIEISPVPYKQLDRGEGGVYANLVISHVWFGEGGVYANLIFTSWRVAFFKKEKSKIT